MHVSRPSEATRGAWATAACSETVEFIVESATTESKYQPGVFPVSFTGASAEGESGEAATDDTTPR